MVLSVWFLTMGQGPARAGFLGPRRITLGAHFGKVVADPQSALGSLFKTISIVEVSTLLKIHLEHGQSGYEHELPEANWGIVTGVYHKEFGG